MPFYRFFFWGAPLKKTTAKKGTLILSSLLEVLDFEHQTIKPPEVYAGLVSPLLLPMVPAVSSGGKKDPSKALGRYARDKEILARSHGWCQARTRDINVGLFVLGVSLFRG